MLRNDAEKNYASSMKKAFARKNPFAGDGEHAAENSAEASDKSSAFVRSRAAAFAVAAAIAVCILAGAAFLGIRLSKAGDDAAVSNMGGGLKSETESFAERPEELRKIELEYSCLMEHEGVHFKQNNFHHFDSGKTIRVTEEGRLTLAAELEHLTNGTVTFEAWLCDPDDDTNWVCAISITADTKDKLYTKTVQLPFAVKDALVIIKTRLECPDESEYSFAKGWASAY